MSESDFKLAESKIAIVGLGLMGGSLALGLRGKCAALYGIDPHLPTLELALSQHIVDYANSDPAKLLPEADLVILSAPVTAILTLIGQLPALMPKPCIVMDLGSTKKLIVESMSRLPERFDPIGEHPEALPTPMRTRANMANDSWRLIFDHVRSHQGFWPSRRELR